MIENLISHFENNLQENIDSNHYFFAETKDFVLQEIDKRQKIREIFENGGIFVIHIDKI